MIVILADEGGKGSPVGLFVILSLCVATYFLVRSMSKHMRKVPESFETPVAPGAAGAGGAAGAAAPVVPPADGGAAVSESTADERTEPQG